MFLNLRELERQAQLAGEPIQIATGPRLFDVALEEAGARVIWLADDTIQVGSIFVRRLKMTQVVLKDLAGKSDDQEPKK